MVCMGDLNEGCMQNKDLLTVWTSLMTLCLDTYVFVYFATKQVVLFIEAAPFWRHIVYYLYQLHQIKLVESVRPHTGAVYIEEKAVYMNNKHDMALQYETRKSLQYYNQ